MVTKTYREATKALSDSIYETLAFEALQGIVEEGFLGVLQMQNHQLVQQWTIQFGDSLEIADPGSNPNEGKVPRLSAQFLGQIAPTLGNARTWLEEAGSNWPHDEGLQQVIHAIRAADELVQSGSTDRSGKAGATRAHQTALHSDAGPGLAWIEAGATPQDLEAIAKAGGPSQTLAQAPDPALSERVDRLLRQRLCNVRNALREMGWAAPVGRQLRMEAGGLLVAFDHREKTRGSSGDWVGLTYLALRASSRETCPAVEPLLRLDDDMTGSSAMMAQQFRAYLQRILHTRGVSVDLRRPYDTVEALQPLTASTRHTPGRETDVAARLQQVTERLEVLGFEMRHPPEFQMGTPPVLTWLWDGEPAVATGPVSKEVAELAEEWIALDAPTSTARHDTHPDNVPNNAEAREDDEHDPSV